MKRRIFLVFLLGLLILYLHPTAVPKEAASSKNSPALEPIPLAQYLSYARSSADWVWSHSNDIIAKWKQGFDPENYFGYSPPSGLLEMAVIYTYLYGVEKKTEYAERAKKVLLTYGEFRSLYPDWAKAKRPEYSDGVPVLPDFFTAMRYIRAYDIFNLR